MKILTAILLVVVLAAPACLCPVTLHANPETAGESSCCSQKDIPQATSHSSGCESGCGHCSSEVKAVQDAPKVSPFAIQQVFVAVLPSVSVGVFHTASDRVAPVPAIGGAPPGGVPLFILHCSLIC